MLHTLIGILNLKGLLSHPVNKKKKIAFQAYAIHLAQFYETIIKSLQKDDGIEVIFVILPHPQFPLSEQDRIRDMAINRFGIASTNVRPYWKTLWEKFDLIFYIDVFARFPLRHSKKALLLHGPVNPPRCFTKGIFRKTVFDFDIILSVGDYDLNLIEKRNNRKSFHSNIFSAGFPFFDRFLEPGITKTEYFKRILLDEKKKTVLYAPHWSITPLLGKNAKGFLLGMLKVLEHFDVNIIIKLHRMSFIKSANRGTDWKFIQDIAVNYNIRYDDSIDDVPSLLFSDILISDISTRIFNFMLLDKPIIMYAPYYKAKNDFEKDRYLLQSEGSYIAESLDELKSTVREALNNPMSMSQHRKKIADICFSHYGRSTHQVVRVINEELAGR